SYHHAGCQLFGAAAFAIEQQPRDTVGISRQLEMAVGSAGLGLRPKLQHAVTENVHDPAVHESHNLDQHGAALPAADTFGGDAAFGAEPLHRIDQMQHDAIAAT